MTLKYIRQLFFILNIFTYRACGDPEILSEGVQLWCFCCCCCCFLVNEGREVPNTIIARPSLACQRSWWWPNIECWHRSFVFFQGIRTSIAKKPYIYQSHKYVIYTLHARIQRGGAQGVRTLPSPLKNYQNIGFLSNTGPTPPKNHKATKPACNVGPSSAPQPNAI